MCSSSLAAPDCPRGPPPKTLFHRHWDGGIVKIRFSDETRETWVSHADPAIDADLREEALLLSTPPRFLPVDPRTDYIFGGFKSSRTPPQTTPPPFLSQVTCLGLSAFEVGYPDVNLRVNGRM